MTTSGCPPFSKFRYLSEAGAVKLAETLDEAASAASTLRAMDHGGVAGWVVEFEGDLSEAGVETFECEVLLDGAARLAVQRNLTDAA